MKKHFNYKKIAGLLVFSAIFLLFVEDCHARIGGGGGYSGRGSGGSSGDDGVGALIYLLIRLSIHHPFIGIPLLIIVVFVAIKCYGTSKSEYQTHTIRKATKKQDNHKRLYNLKRLCERDPKFSLENFENRAKKIFLKLQSSWANQDMNTIRKYVSDSTYERFNILNKMYQENGIKNHVSDINVLECHVVNIKSDRFYDTITVLVAASAVDYFTTESGRKVSGSKKSEMFTEYWSFLRKRGVKSLQSGGLMSGFCPNCGNPLHLNDRTECSSCSSIVTSGEYDWVLAEITQTNVFVPSSGMQISKVNKLTAKDSGFSVQSIEDKVSTAFWFIRYSEFMNNYQFAQRFVTTDCFNKISKQQYSEEWECAVDPAIGSVDLIDFYPAEKDKFDRIRVKVAWSGRYVKKRIGQKFLPDFEKCVRMSHEYILRRKKNISTPTDTSMRSLHCPNCGAPASEKSSAICEYCQTSFVDGSRDWVIETIREFSGYTVMEAANEETGIKFQPYAQVPPKRVAFAEDKLIAVIQVMMADGVIDDKEMSALKSLSSKYGYGEKNLNLLIRSVKSGSVVASKPDRMEDAREMLVEVIKMAMADGRICSKEKALIRSFANQLGYTTAFDINHMMKKAKAELYQESKEALRVLKKNETI